MIVFDQWRLLTDVLVSLLKTVAVLSTLKCWRTIETGKKMTDVDLNTVVANERAAIPAASLKTIGTFFPSVTLKCSFIIFLKRAKNRTGLTGFPKAHSSSGPEQRVMMTSLQILFAAFVSS